MKHRYMGARGTRRDPGRTREKKGDWIPSPGSAATSRPGRSVTTSATLAERRPARAAVGQRRVAALAPGEARKGAMGWRRRKESVSWVRCVWCLRWLELEAEARSGLYRGRGHRLFAQDHLWVCGVVNGVMPVGPRQAWSLSRQPAAGLQPLLFFSTNRKQKRALGRFEC